MIDENNPHSNIETADFWLEDDIFDKKDEKNITNFSNELLKIINENNLFLDFNIPTEKIIEDIFGDDTKNNVTIEDVTDDENIREILPSDVESISEPEEIIVTLQILNGTRKMRQFQLILNQENIIQLSTIIP